MTNKELWEQYQDYTQDVSIIARSLGFAAIAICWIFRESASNVFPPLILFGIRATVIYFVLDLSQYILAALLYRKWIRNAEKEMYKKTGRIEGDYNKPEWLDSHAFFIWFVKLVALLFAYIFIGCYVFK